VGALLGGKTPQSPFLSFLPLGLEIFELGGKNKEKGGLK
jgi:hypothetical protein